MYLYSLLSKAEWYPVLFDTTLHAVRSVATWLTLALLLLLGVCALILKGDRRKRFLRVSAIVAVVYGCALCALYLYSSFKEDGIERILFFPLLFLLLAIATSAIVLSFTRTPVSYVCVAVAVSGAFIAVLVCMAVHFSSGKAAENNWLTNKDVNSVGLYVGALLLTATVVLLSFLFGKKDGRGFDAKTITYAGICIAMSFALSYLRLVRMPQGGSITPASILPLMIFSYAFGTKKGVFVGFIYGLLQAFQTPSILHPAQFLLDYPVAYACIGLSGAFAKTKGLEKYPQLQIALGGVLAGFFRFLMHFTSGIFAFGVFADGENVVAYSLSYQAGYVLPDLAIAIAVAVVIFSSKSIVKEMKKLS